MLLLWSSCKSRFIACLPFRSTDYDLTRNLLSSCPFAFWLYSTTQLGENAPETADLYFSYGKALLENAIGQNSVLGKEQGEEAAEAEESKKGPCVLCCTFIFVF